MRNLFLMSLFGLCMMAASSGQSLADLTLITSAFADTNDDIAAANLARNEADQAQQEADISRANADQAQQAADVAEALAEELDTEEARSAAEHAQEVANQAEELATNDAEQANEAAQSASDAMDIALAFHCPAGITTCYKADGSEYTDVNNLTATATGTEEGDDEHHHDSLASVVKPSHFRSF